MIKKLAILFAVAVLLNTSIFEQGFVLQTRQLL